MTLQGPGQALSPVDNLLANIRGRQAPIRDQMRVTYNNHGVSGPPINLFGLGGVLDPITTHPMLFLLGLAAGIYYAGTKLK